MHIYEQYLSYVNERKGIYNVLVAMLGTLLLALSQIPLYVCINRILVWLQDIRAFGPRLPARDPTHLYL